MQDAFVKFSREVVLLCHITSRVETDPHPDLLHEKGGHGFPYVAFLDSEGALLAEPEGRTVEAFRKTAEQCARLLKARAGAEKGDPRAKAEYLLLRMELGPLAIDEGLAALGELELTGEEKARLLVLKDESEIRSVLESVQDEAGRNAAAAKFCQRVKEGKREPSRLQERYSYYVLVLHGAEQKKDVERFEQAYKALVRDFSGFSGARDFFETVEKNLQELKKAAGRDGK